MSQTALAVIGNIAFPSGRKKRKDFKLDLHWGRVHPESASNPKKMDKKGQEFLSEAIAN